MAQKMESIKHNYDWSKGSIQSGKFREKKEFFDDLKFYKSIPNVSALDFQSIYFSSLWFSLRSMRMASGTISIQK